MYPLLALGVLSLTLCLALTPIFRDLCVRLDFVDQPDGTRKLHSRPIPRIGGVPIAISYVAALGIMLACAPQGAHIVVQHKNLLWSLLPAAAIIFVTGLIDDLLGLKPWQKLIGQFIGASWAVCAGARIPLLAGHHYADFISIPLSVLWLVGCSNAFNLIDGLDGLASGVGFFATLTTLFAALLQGNLGLAMATVPLLGALLGFLGYNFNPASVFLGDCGSLSIGFLLGCFSLIWSQKSATLVGMLAPMMALALPLLDVGLSIGRRYLRNQPIFSPDRGHIHHRLLALGHQPRVAAIILYAACGVAAVLSLLQSSLSYHLGGVCILFFCAFAIYGVKRLNYVEFNTAGRVLRTGGLLRLVQHEVYLEHLSESLKGARTKSECWFLIKDACQTLGFSSLRLDFQGEVFYHVLESSTTGPVWEFTMSLDDGCRLTLTRCIPARSQSLLMSFLHILQEGIHSKVFLNTPLAFGAAANGNLPSFGHSSLTLQNQPAMKRFRTGTE